MAEACHREGVKLQAYSPLAMGLLTGKYLENGGSPTARLNRYADMDLCGDNMWRTVVCSCDWSEWVRDRLIDILINS